MSYEDVIEDIGGFGRWHIFIFFGISLGDLLVSFAMTLPVYVSFTPEWNCEGTHSNGSTNNTVRDDLCTRCLGLDKYFYSEASTIVTEWELVCQLDFVGELITSLQMLGLTLGAFMFAQFSDSYGRKKVQFISVFFLCLSGSISSFSVNWQMFAVLRFLTGVGMGGYLTVNSVYGMEFVSRHWRTLCGVLGWWSVGQVILAGLASVLNNWRHLVFTCSLLGLPYMAFWWILPESPRWLAEKGYTTEAKKIFRGIAKRNKKPVPDLSGLEAMRKQKVERKYTYLDLFRRKDMAWRSMCAAWLWFTIFIMYYVGFFSVGSLSGNRHINGIFGALMDLLAVVVIILFSNMVGRKKLMNTGVLMILISNGLLLTFKCLYFTNTLWTNMAAQFGRLGAGVGSYTLIVYGAEIYPTAVRNLGFGLGQIAARLGAFCAPQVMYLGKHYRLLPYILMVILCLLDFPFYWLLPETSGMPLVDDYSVTTIVVSDKTRKLQPTDAMLPLDNNEKDSEELERADFRVDNCNSLDI